MKTIFYFYSVPLVIIIKQDSKCIYICWQLEGFSRLSCFLSVIPSPFLSQLSNEETQCVHFNFTNNIFSLTLQNRVSEMKGFGHEVKSFSGRSSNVNNVFRKCPPGKLGHDIRQRTHCLSSSGDKGYMSSGKPDGA